MPSPGGGGLSNSAPTGRTIMAELLNFDYRVFQIFNSLAGRTEGWDAVFVALSEYTMFALILGLAVYLFVQKKGRAAAQAAIQALAAAFIGRALIVPLIRAFFFRARPFVEGAVTQLVSHDPSESAFPSGHATVMFALAFSLFFKNARFGTVYLILATVSSFSRVVVGVHFPLDIVGGMLVGALGAFAAEWIFKTWVIKHRSQS